MRDAGFLTVFVGIETPKSEVLTEIDKAHNAALPMLEAIDTLNRYGLEVTSGIIMGLDLKTDESEGKRSSSSTARRYQSSPLTSCKLCRKRPYGTDWRARVG